ncbi:MAG: hypothetical protein ABIG68_04860 [Acidobacteriota bacterium]
MPQATYEDANLILRLYELRREEKLRRARDWFAREFSARTMAEVQQKYPPGSEENAYIRMVTTYWEMACSFLVQGIVHEELFFETGGEAHLVWEKVRPFLAEMREAFKNPAAFHNLEEAATRRIAWLQKNAPGSYEAFQTRMGLNQERK